MPFWFVTGVFFKILKLQCPNQGSHMMEFLLLSLISVCMIVIRALTGMQLRSNEEKMLRWQIHGVFCCGSKNNSKLLFSQLICTFQVKFSSIHTPRDFVNFTCFIELPSIVKEGSLLKVFNLCLEPININSVFDLLRVILFADNYSVILVRSSFIFSSR